MSVRKMVIKVKHIIIGTINNIFNRNSNIAYPRLLICKKCNLKKYVFKLGYICKQCGCILKSKATIDNEICPLKKW